MLEQPEISEQLIVSGIQAGYLLDVNAVTFLPLGYDVNTAVYRIDTKNGLSYFLKLRRGHFKQVSVALPHFLSSIGISTIIPPLETIAGKLFGKFGDYTAVLYPYIPGRDGYGVRLTRNQWAALGETLKKVHNAHLPTRLLRLLPHETYHPHWRESVKQFQSMVARQRFADPVAGRLAAFLEDKREEIHHMVIRTEELAHALQKRTLGFVLCHSDAHPGNYLLADNGNIYLVDWDDPILAPKERDLMFFGAGMSGDVPGGVEEQLFYRAYGEVEIDQAAIVYYRYERIIQDIAEFCKQLLLSGNGGEDRQQAYNFLASSFQPGSVVEAALLSDAQLKAGGEADDNNRNG